MAVYYVSTSGNDANNGLGPDASHASNKPWRTLGKLLGASGFASGDTAYIGPGVYRETVTVAMTSATAETKVYGDPRNEQGFKNGSGVLLAAQPVRWTAWTTDDKTTPAANALLTLAGRDFLTFQDIWFYGTSAGNNMVATSTGASTNITFRRCLLYSPAGNSSNANVLINSTGAPTGTTITWLFDACVFWSMQGTNFSVQPASSASADYDLGISIQNCLFINFGGTCINVSKSGANSFLGGGVAVTNCQMFARLNGVLVSTGASLTYPCKVYNCTLQTNGAALVGVSTGDIIEDYNQINAATARTNVSAGGNSVTSYAPMFNLGQAELWGFLPRQPFSPVFDSPQLGFGASGSAPTLTTDMLGRDRPSGPGITWANALKAAGCFEFHDFAVKESSVTDSGDGWKLTGPGDQDIQVPVDATSTTISVKVRYDTNHGTGSKPQAELIAAADLGVSAETKTATVGVDTWETLTFSAFTPSSAGWVTIRLRSRSAAGNGLCYFDTIAVT